MFNIEQEIERIIEFIKHYFEENNIKGVVLGISGGKDSAVVAALFVKALGKEHVIGLTMPCHSNKNDQVDAKKVQEAFGFRLYSFDLIDIFNQYIVTVRKSFSSNIMEDTIMETSMLNLKPRLRMISNYFIAQLFSDLEKEKYIVAGTSNLCERYVGYFTKGGDNVYDIDILGNFTTEEVVAIGEVLKVPKEILYKKPHDGLSTFTDEEKLQVSYNEITTYIKTGKIDNKIHQQRIEKLHQENKHKFYIPTYERSKMEKIISTIIKELAERHETLATMESCTGGAVANAITNIENAGDILQFSAVTYSNRYKMKMGVEKETIDKYTVYSKETALSMAKHIAEFANSTYGIGITGKLNKIDKNNPFGKDNLCFVCIYNRKEKSQKALTIKATEKTRKENKQKIVYETLHLLKEWLNVEKNDINS